MITKRDYKKALETIEGYREQQLNLSAVMLSLPTDEEILNERSKLISHHTHSGDYHFGWFDGVKWLRERLIKAGKGNGA